MKKNINLIIILLGIIALVVLFFFYRLNNKKNSYKNLYYKELQNVEAYRIDNSVLKDQTKQYQMTITDLINSRDSIDKKLTSTLTELKLNKNKIKELQYQVNNISKIDTICLTDTIFIKNLKLDTSIGNEWYNLNLELQYPSTIITDIKFKSEQYIYIYSKKEYVGGKSNIFFINWFKKKYNSTEVRVKENNPYVDILEQKYIKIK